MQPLYGSPKVKSRTVPSVVVSGQYDDVFNASHVLQSHTPISAYTTATNAELITYTTKRIDNRAKSNYCYHLKEIFQYGGGTNALTLGGTGPQTGWTVDYRSHHAHACNARGTIVNAVDTALVSTLGGVLGGGGLGYMNEAFANMQPDLTSVSIPNFLLDLKELKSLYTLWKERTKLYPRFIRNVRNATKKDVISNAAGRHLAYKFGWKPTVADITDLIMGVTKLREKLAAFESGLGKVIQSSRVVNLTFPTSVTGSISYPSGSHSVSYRAWCTRKCTAYIAYAPQPLAVMGSLDKVLRALLDLMGFELNPRIIWDYIPFSFVIDWFFDVGSFISRYKVDALELPIILVDAYLQYEEHTNIDWTWLRANDSLYTSRPKSGGATVQRDFFHRMPIFPDFASLAGLGWRTPTLGQAALGLSLATVLGMSKSRR